MMRYTNTLACNTSVFNTQKPALKIKHFQETTSSMKQLGKLKIFTAEMACLKTSLFCKLFQSMNWVFELQNIEAQITCLNRFSLCSNRFSLWNELGNFKFLKTNSLLEELNFFLQTDSIYEKNWISSKFL